MDFIKQRYFILGLVFLLTVKCSLENQHENVTSTVSEEQRKEIKRQAAKILAKIETLTREHSILQSKQGRVKDEYEAKVAERGRKEFAQNTKYLATCPYYSREERKKYMQNFHWNFYTSLNLTHTKEWSPQVGETVYYDLVDNSHRTSSEDWLLGKCVHVSKSENTYIIQDLNNGFFHKIERQNIKNCRVRFVSSKDT